MDDPNFIGNIQSIIIGRQPNTGLLLSVGPYEGVVLATSMFSVVEFLHGLFDPVLIGLDVHSEHSVLLSSIFFMADPVVRGNLMMAWW